MPLSWILPMDLNTVIRKRACRFPIRLSRRVFHPIRSAGWTSILDRGRRPMRAQTTLLLACTLPLLAQSQADRDWPMFNRDLAGTRYSPLKQINTANVAKLTKAWHYRFNREGKPINGAQPQRAVSGDHAHRRQRRHVYAVGRSRGRARARNRQRNLDLRSARQGPRVVPRRGLLAGRPQQSAAHHLHHRPQDDGAERAHRQSRSGLRQGRLGRPRSALRRRADHLQEPAVRRDEFLRTGRAAHRSAARSGRRADSRTARLRRPHRQGAVDVPHVPA